LLLPFFLLLPLLFLLSFPKGICCRTCLSLLDKHDLAPPLPHHRKDTRHKKPVTTPEGHAFTPAIKNQPQHWRTHVHACRKKPAQQRKGTRSRLP
jgi:hypothetical protein